MAEVYKKLYQGVVPSSATTIYTVPLVTNAIIKNIMIVNTSGGSTTIKIWQSGTADGNVILPAQTIPAGGFLQFDGTICMAASDTLAAQAGAGTSITLTVHGLEVS